MSRTEEEIRRDNNARIRQSYKHAFQPLLEIEMEPWLQIAEEDGDASIIAVEIGTWSERIIRSMQVDSKQFEVLFRQALDELTNEFLTAHNLIEEMA